MGIRTLLAILSIWCMASASASEILQNQTAADELGSQSIRILVQLKPGDIHCKDAHPGDFGRIIPGVISFSPMKGDTGWWWNKITDYDQRVTRIESFFKVLSQNEKCADFNAELPQSNAYFQFERKVLGNSGVSMDGRQTGQLVEKVNMIVSPKVTLAGENQWIDWNVSTSDFDPKRAFKDTFINEFSTFTDQFPVQTDANSQLECKMIESRMNLTFNARESAKNNNVSFRRLEPDMQTCIDAMTKLEQALEVRGRPWLNIQLPASRSLYRTSRDSGTGECDEIRVERLETEVEGVKFVGTNFIPVGSGSAGCRPSNR